LYWLLDPFRIGGTQRSVADDCRGRGHAMVSESSLSRPVQPSANEATASKPPPRRSLGRHLVLLLYGLLLAYLAVAYVVMPAYWKVHTHRHPALDSVPNITHTGSGIPGDPLNVALIGTEPR
jgi:hypothetical protein